ncbi:MAG: hypothetical protein GX896_02010, partial [Clostridiales bacterium]|nr:hypothetical protein [Clostridiales bacterium]
MTKKSDIMNKFEKELIEFINRTYREEGNEIEYDVNLSEEAEKCFNGGKINYLSFCAQAHLESKADISLEISICVARMLLMNTCKELDLTKNDIKKIGIYIKPTKNKVCMCIVVNVVRPEFEISKYEVNSNKEHERVQEEEQMHFDEEESINADNHIGKLLSDAEYLMPNKIKKESKFVDLLVEVNKENVKNVFKQINEDNVKKACKIIDFSINIRPLEVDSFLTLIFYVSSKFGVDNLPHLSDYFSSLLISRGILPKRSENKKYSAKFAGFATGSIEEAIRKDNVEHFCELISDPSFNAKDNVKFDPYGLYNYYLMEKCESYMQLITFFGAVNCFKRAIMNDSFDLNDISKYAIAGGSNEIVLILEQKGISFDNCFEVGV